MALDLERTEEKTNTTGQLVYIPNFAQEPNQNASVDKDEDEAGFDYLKYAYSVRKRLWLVILMTVLGCLAAMFFNMRLIDTYKSSTTILVGDRTPTVLTEVQDVVDSGSNWWYSTQFLNTELRILKSRKVARRAGEILGIVNNPERNGLGALQETNPDEYARRVAELDPADFVSGRYQVQGDSDNKVVTITASSIYPEYVAEFVNAVAEAYIDLNMERRVSGTEKASEWLGVQHRALKTKLEKSEDALYEFMEEQGVLNASLDSQLSEVKQRLTAFITKLAEVEGAQIQMQLDADALRRAKVEPELLQTLAQVQNVPIIGNLEGRILELENTQTELLTKYKSAHPKVRAVDQQLVLANKALKKEIGYVLSTVDREIRSLENTRRGLEKAVNDERLKEARLNKLSLEYNRLRREVETNEKLYDMVTNRMKETDLTGAIRFNNVRILDAARVPSAPYSPNRGMNLLMGLLAGLLLGILFAILIDILDATVKSQHDVEQVIKEPFLGLLPIIPVEGMPGKGASRAEILAYLRKRDRYVIENPRSSISEFMKFIRTNLMFMSPDNPQKVLMLTSPGPQEGKSTCSIYLSSAMAASGSRTLLIDGDMRRPRLHHSFHLENEVGLSSLIVGQANLDEAVQSSGTENLDIMTCGPIPPNPAELLHSKAFPKLVQEMAQRYDRVVFDAPPVGVVADPMILGVMVDACILVFRAHRTTKAAAKRAYRQLRDAKVNIVGSLLNNVDLTKAEYGSNSSYYHYYYRQYGYYAVTPDEDDETEQLNVGGNS